MKKVIEKLQLKRNFFKEKPKFLFFKNKKKKVARQRKKTNKRISGSKT